MAGNSEMLESVRYLTTLSDDHHWLCERGDPKGEYPAQRRITATIYCLELFSEPTGNDSLGWFKSKVSKWFTCQHCVKNWHKGKRDIRIRYEGEFGKDVMDQFIGNIEEWDAERLTPIVTEAARTLNEAGQSTTVDRLKLVGNKALVGLYDCLFVPNVLERHYLFGTRFQESFLGVQQNGKHMRVPDVVPAFSAFLFSPHEGLRRWATKCLEKYPQGDPSNLIDARDFETWLQIHLENAVIQASQTNDEEKLSIFWSGASILMRSMKTDAIVQCICGSNFDLFRMAVVHLQGNSAHLRYILCLLHVLLEKLTTGFWDAVGSMPPVALLEMIFNNPRFEKNLLDVTKQTDGSDNVLDDMTAWIQPFILSLKLSLRTSSCSSILHQSFGRLQEARYPIETRNCLTTIGLKVLHATMIDFPKEDFLVDDENHQGNRIIVKEITNIVNRNCSILVTTAISPHSHNAFEARSVISIVLQMECKILHSDFMAFNTDNYVPTEPISPSEALWRCILDSASITSSFGNCVLGSVCRLAGLESLTTCPNTSLAQDFKQKFNASLSQLKSYIASFMNRLADGNSETLKELLRDEKAGVTIISSLFDPFSENFHSAVDITKQAFGTLEKIDALYDLLKTQFQTTLKHLEKSICLIREYQTFFSMPRFVKTCDSIIDVFCAPQNGLLTLGTVGNSETERLLLRQFWKTQWTTLGTLFDRSMKWSLTVEKDIMVEFTRDVMQYADKLFSQFTIFETALLDDDSSGSLKVSNDSSQVVTAQGRDLLSNVSSVLERVLSWLRLRDEALLSMCQVLACKMLKRLHSSGVKLDVATLTLCLNMAKGTRRKYTTKMTPEQRAELNRAVTLYTGVLKDGIASATAKPTKPGLIDMEKWRNAAASKIEGVSVNQELVESTVAKKPAEAKIPIQKQEQKQPPQTTRPALAPAPAPAPKRPAQKQSSSKPGGSSLMRDLKSGVRDEIRARNALQASIPPAKPSSTSTSIPTSTEGSNLKKLDSLIESAKIPPPRQPIVIGEDDDSEESSGDEEEDTENAIFALTRTVKATKQQKELRRANLLDGDRNPFRIQQPFVSGGLRRPQSAADIRARLAPDLTKLYRRILSWDYLHSGPFPPDSNTNDYSFVAQSFANAKEYKKTFKPLLMLECWQQFMKVKEEAASQPFDLAVVTRLAVDSFVEVQTTITTQQMASNSLAPSDMIFLSIGGGVQSSTSDESCMGRVHTVNRKQTHVEISIRCLPSNTFLPNIRPNVKLKATKILSLTPLEREFAALKGLPYYNLCDEIIKGKPQSYSDFPQNKVQKTMKTYGANEPQAKAIIGAVQNEGFSLIQGPPGTGKTKTVIGIVGALLSDNGDVSVDTPGSRNQASTPNSSTKKLLVCAPSNAAVDELVVRFKLGVRTTKGDKMIPKIVRLGRSDVINAAVRDVTLEELIDKKMNLAEKEETSNNKGAKSSEELRKEMNGLLQEREAKKLALDHARANKDPSAVSLDRDFEALRSKIKSLGRQLDDCRDQKASVNRNRDIRRRQIMQEILDSADIVCATLSGTGHEMLRNMKLEFETVIIDEAAQSIELSALIPLKFGCVKCILVGDPKQLPPTVLSREASRFAYEQSLFVRMQKNFPQTVHLLSIQYRMHPHISLFPSRMFYDSQLEDGRNMEKLRTQRWHDSTIFGPYRFFNVQGQEQLAGHSLRNTKEVNAAMKIYNRLLQDFHDIDFRGKIGIITPYKTQLRDLKEKFQKRYGDDILNTIEFNTTDAFQGRERDIIIFSCVRASQKGSVGFLSDIRRMNVGLTRAKSSLFVLGNAATLQSNEFWGKLLNDARERGLFTGGDTDNLLDKPSRLQTKQITQRMEQISISPTSPGVIPVTFEEQDSPDMTMSSPEPEKAPPIADDKPCLPVENEKSDAPMKSGLSRGKKKTLDGTSKSKRVLPDEEIGFEERKRPRTEIEKIPLPVPNTDDSSPKVPTSKPRPSVIPGSKGPAPMRRKKNAEDAMFIRRKR